mgnify:CR=1 FL=1
MRFFKTVVHGQNRKTAIRDQEATSLNLVTPTIKKQVTALLSDFLLFYFCSDTVCRLFRLFRKCVLINDL